MVLKYFIDVILPSVLFVSLGYERYLNSSFKLYFAGYCNLFMPMSQVTARVGVGMTTLLTLVSMYSGVRQSTPDVSYVSYLDIWMMICLLCVISFIFEFIIITHLINKQLYPEESFEKFETWFRILFPVCFLTVSGLFWAMIFYYH